MVGAYLGMIAFFTVPLLYGWMLLEGFRTGSIRARGARYSRADDPMWFWIIVIVDVTVLAVFVVVAGLIGWDALNNS